nr:PREDICTED: meiosis-specific protein MEI4-like [Latimeria chalumnae]|eukprot:XP_014354177.1 PREDICTED: meiosis-specific protein MEI4-like [Latimeria chalumnae]
MEEAGPESLFNEGKTAPLQTVAGGAFGKEQPAWYLKTIKLALALAIIRTRPPGKSSREYTKYLARVLSCQEEKWRTKAEALEAEVLRLRQELLLYRVHSALWDSNNGENSAFHMEPVSREFVNDCMQIDDDSGCDTSTEKEINSLDLCTLEHPEVQYLNASSFTFSSAVLLSKQIGWSVKEKTLFFHTQFLQNLIGLRKLAEQGSLTADLMALGSDCSVITDSVSQVVHGVITFCKDPKPFSSDSYLIEAVKVLGSLINEAQFPKPVFNQCYKKVEELEREIMKLILENKDINRFVQTHASPSDSTQINMTARFQEKDPYTSPLRCLPP